MSFDKDDPMWINDPDVCRERDPNWYDKIERMNFESFMNRNLAPEAIYPRDPAARARYIEFLKSNNSPIAEQ